MPKIKNILIFTAIAATFVLIYVFFVRPSPDEKNLVSSQPAALPDINSPSAGASSKLIAAPLVAKDFLSLLLNVKNIRLNDDILSDPAFLSLRDSSIVLVPDGNEGRPNPFAQFGNDAITTPIIPTIPIGSTPPAANSTPAKP